MFSATLCPSDKVDIGETRRGDILAENVHIAEPCVLVGSAGLEAPSVKSFVALARRTCSRILPRHDHYGRKYRHLLIINMKMMRS